MAVRGAAPAIVAVALALAGCGERTATGPASRVAQAPCLGGQPAPAPAPSTAGMVLIRGGDFEMGARPRHAEEGPPRRTTVGDFWIDRTEVTNADFERFVAATGYVTEAEKPLDPKAYPGLSPEQRRPSAIVFVGAEHPGTDPSAWWQVVQGADWRHPTGPRSSIRGQQDKPVVQVSWADAMAYARWLGRDLPTEAEWEYAAQGGKAVATRFVWGDQPLDPERPQANVWQGVFPVMDSGGDGYKVTTAPVGCYPANGFGLHDMAGNVWEWTRDWYRPGLDPADGDRPEGPAASLAHDPGDPGQRKHVIKGGSFLCSPDFCFRYRPAARQAGPTDTGENHIGFRTVLRVGGR
ncbi:MAG: gliding motility-associated lipoprotein GldK [Phenylobacterium zucineum]|nr:MAG: gliding motility-associated lipoprotein GldK [Phenylobacterium zucineum]